MMGKVLSSLGYPYNACAATGEQWSRDLVPLETILRCQQGIWLDPKREQADTMAGIDDPSMNLSCTTVAMREFGKFVEKAEPFQAYSNTL
jgi:hypothetical protein